MPYVNTLAPVCRVDAPAHCISAPGPARWVDAHACCVSSPGRCVDTPSPCDGSLLHPASTPRHLHLFLRKCPLEGIIS